MRRALCVALFAVVAPVVVAAHSSPASGSGLSVVAVVPGSAAEAAGLAAGDRIVAVDEREIGSRSDLEAVLASHRTGDRVTVAVDRDGSRLALPLVFGERPDGGPSMGLSLADPGAHGPAAGAAPADGLGREECLDWVDATYRLVEVGAGLGLDLAQTAQDLRRCMERDVWRMAVPIPVGWCDNVFKIHCSGIDLLTEIGEAQEKRCERELEAALGVAPRLLRSWTHCAREKVFDRYSLTGETSDVAACRSTLLEECGARLDGLAHGELSVEQRRFVACCSAASPDGCPMIAAAGDGGPCAGLSPSGALCVDRQTGDWLTCGESE